MIGLVEKLNGSAFAPNNFLPSLNFQTADLFGYESQVRNMDLEYQFSCRVMVDLLKSRYGVAFERARDGIQKFVLEFLSQFVPDGNNLHIRAMSLLLQVPFGGQCQVWHTDEGDDDDDENDFVYSILIPCHRQSAPVFLKEISPKSGPSGEKPLLGLGDMVFWDAKHVVHAGSSADKVPPGHLLRAAVFISIGSKAPKIGAAQIHSGPDVDQWKKCAHPIIRFCVRCRRGVQPCEPRMKYCRLCVGNGFQAMAVVCQWCHESDDHLHSDTKLIIAGENQLLKAIWCGYATLCVHGNPHFVDMSSSERLLLHFDKDELCRGFSFWKDFMMRVVPDECFFEVKHCRMSSEAWTPWQYFFKCFVKKPRRERSVCPRCYGILRVTALLCGFSSLLEGSDSAPGSIPVFVASEKLSAHAGAYLTAFHVVQANADRLALDQIDENRILRALLWLESDDVTTHCSCHGWEEEFEGTVVPLSFHHQVRKCPGATLGSLSGLKQSKAVEIWGNLFFSRAVLQEGQKFVFFFALLI